MRTTPKLAQKLGFGASSPKKQFSVNFAGGEEERRRGKNPLMRQSTTTCTPRAPRSSATTQHASCVVVGYSSVQVSVCTWKHDRQPNGYWNQEAFTDSPQIETGHLIPAPPSSSRALLHEKGEKTASISTRARSPSARFCQLIESANILCTLFAIKKCLDDLQEGNLLLEQRQTEKNNFLLRPRERPAGGNIEHGKGIHQITIARKASYQSPIKNGQFMTTQ